MIAKTTKARADVAVAALRSLHPYEVPEIIVLPGDGRPCPLPRLGASGDRGFLTAPRKWVHDRAGYAGLLPRPPK